jgi:hypothetical protein
MAQDGMSSRRGASREARVANKVSPAALEARNALRYGNEDSGPVDIEHVPAGVRSPVYGASSQEEMITTTSRGS